MGYPSSQLQIITPIDAAGCVDLLLSIQITAVQCVKMLCCFKKGQNSCCVTLTDVNRKGCLIVSGYRLTLFDFIMPLGLMIPVVSR